jgi:hypothetical protein
MKRPFILIIILFTVSITFGLFLSSQTKKLDNQFQFSSSFPPPIDPQKVQDQDTMTWNDYHPIPGFDWSNQSLKPERYFKLAVVAVDFPDQPFVITLPKGSDPFGNPQVEPIPRDKVPQFYANFFTKPLAVNHGLNIHHYWMWQSRGKFGLSKVDVFGPYKMPRPHWWYGLNEYNQNKYTPDGSVASGDLEKDCDELWIKNIGQDIRKNYDAVLGIYAGYDETGVWMEFGLMKFKSKEDIPPEWGNPNPSMPRWVPTRYVDWTSWLAGSQQWGLSSIRQGENSGTIPHELGHFAFNLPDLNNNPYVHPFRRAAVGPWDLMDRGCFNGPGGPHRRWVVPPVAGAASPPGLMIRNRMACGFICDGQLLSLSREGLARSGIVVAEVTAREVDPLPGTYTGINVYLDGPEPQDRTPADDPASNPLSPGIPDYNFYSLEVVERIGFDSFCPDSGVLIAKNKNKLWETNGGPNAFDSYIWVIDAHPEDINMIDYISPSGEKVMRTIADYRQLNDALFHAGLNSGSQYEYEDTPNRLHFYLVDVHRNKDGILSYTLAVRSLDGSGPQKRAVRLETEATNVRAKKGAVIPLSFKIKNSGQPVEVNSSSHPSYFSRHLNYDLYRLEASIKGRGWKVFLPNALSAVEFGQEKEIIIYVLPSASCSQKASLSLKASSESQPEKKAEVTVNLSL